MAKRLQNLVGDTVIRLSGESVEEIRVESLCGKDSVIGIYFSAHWCPPCRGFTPKLIEFYNNEKQKRNGTKFEIIFVSWDRDETSFKEYFATMPWLALPYDPDKKHKGKLTKKFRVQGIPKLVLIDGENGKTITVDGYTCLTDNPNGEGFPWRRKKVTEVIKGPIITSNKTEVEALEALKGKYVGLYFSAHWCPPCKAFTPELIRIYELLKSNGKNMEFVFVSSDRSQDSFDLFFDSMPWMAIPFGDPRTEALKGLFGIDGIPSLVMIDDKGEIINLNGRAAVVEDIDAKEFPWYPKPLNELTGSASVMLNESACLVLFTEGEDSDIDMAIDVLSELAKEESEKGEDQELFFFFGADDDICYSVRDFASLDDQCPLLVIFDFPEQKIYVCKETDITKDIARAFVKSYFNETLESRPLKPTV